MFKFAHVVITTLHNRVDVRDQLEIWVKIKTKFLAVGVGKLLLPRIYMGKHDTYYQCVRIQFIRNQLQLVFVHWALDHWALKILYFLKLAALSVSSTYRLCLTSLSLYRTKLRGVVYIINWSGPITEPWGTSNMISMWLDRIVNFVFVFYNYRHTLFNLSPPWIN